MANAETANQVLVVTDPGYSGFSLKIAQNITEQLIRKNLSVKLVKVNQFRVQDLARVQLIVIGGPTYMAQPSGGLKKFVSKLKSGSGLKALVFQTGGTDCAGLAPLVKLVQEKGLLVIGSCGILQTPNEATENDNKIKKLLENI